MYGSTSNVQASVTNHFATVICHRTYALVTTTFRFSCMPLAHIILDSRI